MTKKQLQNLVSLKSVAILLNTMSPNQRYMIWELFRLFEFEQIERILNVALAQDQVMTGRPRKRKYTRRKVKKGSKKNETKP